MLRKILSFGAKKEQFILQINDSFVSVVKCRKVRGRKREFMAFISEPLSFAADSKVISDKLREILKKLGYKNNPVIISLPRQLATCRYIKIPSQSPKEVEHIVSLQATRYLPYSAEELISGYQVATVDKEGYSHINLIIVRREIIERYNDMLKSFNPASLSVVLSSYGISNLYGLIYPKQEEPLMLIDINSNFVEIVVLSHKKVIFSRSFRHNSNNPNWKELMADEINKTRDAFVKEVFWGMPNRAIIIECNNIAREYANFLNRGGDFKAEAVTYCDKVLMAKEAASELSRLPVSFASLVGLGLHDCEESLNLVSNAAKQKTRMMSRAREYLGSGMLICGVIFVLGLGMVKNIDNKNKFLEQLKSKLSLIEKEAKPLEEIEKRAKLLDERSRKGLSGLEVVSALYQAVPDTVSLTNLVYEEDEQLTLRGLAPELNTVFAFVSKLEKVKTLNNFTIKVKFATKKKVQGAGELVDFEITGMKK